MTVQTDHRPLEIIARKPLQAVPQKLQGMLMHLQRYQMIITYKPGKELMLADMLSRAHLDKTRKGGLDKAGEVLSIRSLFGVEMKNVNAVDCRFISNSKIQDIQKATAEDRVLQELMTTIHRGWPEGKDRLNPVLAPYHSFRDELVVKGGVIYHGDRYVFLLLCELSH